MGKRLAKLWSEHSRCKVLGQLPQKRLILVTGILKRLKRQLSMRMLILMMLLWLAVLIPSQMMAQIKPLKPGESYINGSFETVFIVPRSSLERLLVKAQGFDSIAPLFPPLLADTALLRAQNQVLYKEVISQKREKWLMASLTVILGIVLVFK